MGRVLFWVALWILSLGLLSGEIRYTDGLKIKLVSWPQGLAKLFKKNDNRN